ncbi:MAG: hypothetical protein R3B13_03815 [Polyangiaceae bacterium]
MHRGATGLLLASTVFTTACSTRYIPRAGPHISMVMEGGSQAYSKHGKVYKHGFAGSGLVEAVEDDPEALEAAETYQSRMTSGFLLVIAGTLCLTASIVILASRDPLEGRSSKYDSLAAGTALCGLGGYIGGGAVMASGLPYHFDAINIYNDNVDRRRGYVPLGYPPPAVPGYAPPGVPMPLPSPAPAPSSPAPPATAPPAPAPLVSPEVPPSDPAPAPP